MQNSPLELAYDYGGFRADLNPDLNADLNADLTGPSRYTAPMSTAKHSHNALDAGLYIVATPLGHARDITLRALDVLAGADLILCEDTRISAKLLTLHNIQTPSTAYHEHNGQKMRPKILARLAEGQRIALISDAGTPLISDPGMKLVRDARAADCHVVAIPGASAPIAALSIAGLPSDRFTFAGFLPPKQAARRAALEGLKATRGGTLILFEAARRLTDLLADIEAVYGASEVCVARELTKKFEEVQRGTAGALRAHYEAAKPRGEITVLIAPPEMKTPDAADIDAMLRDAMETLSRRDAVQAVADMSGQSRRAIYARALALNDPDMNMPNMDYTDTPQKATQKQEAKNAPSDETPSDS
jgi:16S rRNA (cytidine1402-2'-O)-methyltransferase